MLDEYDPMLCSSIKAAGGRGSVGARVGAVTAGNAVMFLSSAGSCSFLAS